MIKSVTTRFVLIPAGIGAAFIYLYSLNYKKCVPYFFGHSFIFAYIDEKPVVITVYPQWSKIDWANISCHWASPYYKGYYAEAATVQCVIVEYA